MVFTGIVEEMGDVVSMSCESDLLLWDGSRGSGWILKVRMQKGLIDAYEGASIAINGVCLTVLEWPVKDGVVSFGVAPETIKLTNLGDLETGDKVNVERSQKADGRNSGHYVQGHVDNTGVVTEKYMDGESLRVRMRAPPDLAPYILKKGYIAIDGTSLTITEADPTTGIFAIMLVPHTQSKIVLPDRAVGDRVNLEVDVMTKAAMQQSALQTAGTSRARLGNPDAAGLFCGLCALGMAGLLGWSFGARSSARR